ncbi:platelet endothelial aggregation receptor 1-like [Saccostrea cucullata]|uniref:platelet endothelial aggregation receptor 1-like n=1 Tax=Saccostrea cuccullata TaxID=36930 RepID=UPI002ED5823B
MCERGYMGCCSGYIWNERDRVCQECGVGYTGDNCSFTCPYPLYGKKCWNTCHCDNVTCLPTIGCISTTEQLPKSSSESKTGSQHETNRFTIIL